MSVETLDRPRADPAPIDPRIRARRIMVRRDEGRRRLHRLAELAAVSAVVVGFLVALRTPLLDVDRVEVGGADRTGSAAVLAAAGVEPGTPLIDVDLARVADRVGELPWIQDVTVRRTLGGTVSVEVTERVPVAVAASGDARWLVDATGAALAPAADAPAGAGPLVTVVGVEPGLRPGTRLGDAAAPALLVAEQLARAVPGAITELRAGDDLVGVLATGGEVRLGDARQLDAKLLTLATLLAEVDLGDLAVLDVRLPGNPVLTREDR